MTFLWSLAGLLAGIYCIVRGVRDLREKRYVWGALAIASAAVFILTPIQTEGVKLDLPLAESR